MLFTTYNLEEMIHDNFEDKRLRHEWFDLNKEDVVSIIETLKYFNKERLYLTKIGS